MSAVDLDQRVKAPVTPEQAPESVVARPAEANLLGTTAGTNAKPDKSRETYNLLFNQVATWCGNFVKLLEGAGNAALVKRSPERQAINAQLETMYNGLIAAGKNPGAVLTAARDEIEQKGLQQITLEAFKDVGEPIDKFKLQLGSPTATSYSLAMSAFTVLLNANPLGKTAKAGHVAESLAAKAKVEPHGSAHKGATVVHADKDASGKRHIDTLRSNGFAVLPTKPDPALAAQLAQGFSSIPGVKPGYRFAVGGLKYNRLLGGETRINLPAEALHKLEDWAETVLATMQKAFPNEPLFIEGLAVGKGFTASTPHVDNRGTYLHATRTLEGPSTIFYPEARGHTELGPAVQPDLGHTGILTGADRRDITEHLGMPPAPLTYHAGPANPDDSRITIFLSIANRDQKIDINGRITTRLQYDWESAVDDMRGVQNVNPLIGRSPEKIEHARYCVTNVLADHRKELTPDQVRELEDFLAHKWEVIREPQPLG